ncbi:MAG: 50S ribosomal protein L10 [archaeon]
MDKPKARVSDVKKKEVVKLEKLFQEYPVVGVINAENLPSKQLQQVKSQIKNTVFVVMSKKRLIKIALEKLKGKVKGIDQLISHLKGMPMLVFTKDNPFKLYRLLASKTTSAAAKPGQNAPNDLTIEAGPTPFPPGPIIGELGKAGLKTAIEDGKVVVKAPKVVVREGEVITKGQAELLTKFGLEPMEIGLNLVATFENGLIYEKSVLAVDQKEYIANIKRIGVEAIALAITIGYINKDTVDPMIRKAYTEAKALATAKNIEY